MMEVRFKRLRISQAMSKILIAALTLQLLGSMISVGQGNAASSDLRTTTARPDGKNLVFPVVSDIHIGKTSKDVPKWQMVLNQLKQIAPGYDAFAAVGDITDTGTAAQYDTLMSNYHARKEPNAVPLFTIGNHDYISGTQQRFKEKTGMSGIYYDQWINGYHFIILGSEDGTRDGTLSDTQLDWLDVKLAEEQDANKPIFVFLHQPITNTVYGSDLWGHKQNATKLYNTLAKYPQVITFSGHSHYVLDDPGSVMQKDFTSVGTSAVRYPELEPGKIQGIHPTDEITQGLVVEVLDQEVHIKRRDFHANAWTGDDWVIKYPAVKSEFTYTSDRDKVKPSFPAAAKAAIDPTSIGTNKMSVTFDQATDNLFVRSYEVKAVNATTGAAAQSFLAFAQMYDDPAPSQLSFEISGLQPATKYRVEVTAIDAFSNRSDVPLTDEATTKVRPPATERPVADVIDIDFLDGTANDRSPARNHATSTGSSAKIVYSPEFRQFVGRMNGTTNEYFAIPTSSSIKAVTKAFTIESMFKLNTIRTQDVFGNTQSGGLGFESTSTGKMELWAHINGGYKRVGAQLQAGKIYHLVAAYDGGQIVMYLNGVNVGSIAVTGTLSQPDIQFAIGADPEASNRGNYVLDGDVSVARLYSSAIYPEQVQMLYDDLTQRMAITEIDTLYSEIQAARQLADNTELVGSAPGQYPASAMNTYKKKIAEAEQTFASKIVTKEAVQQEIAQIKIAKTELDTHINVELPDNATTLVLNEDAVASGQAFTVNMELNRVTTSTYAEDFTLQYDASALEFVDAKSLNGDVNLVSKSENTPGTIRLISASLGDGKAIIGSTPLIELTFKAKPVEEAITVTIAITDALLGDAQGNEAKAKPSTLAVTIMPDQAEGSPDVNHDGKVSVGDLAIVAAQYGKTIASPDWQQVKIADINRDGKIDILDLSAVASQIIGK
ncbi:LamG-like jellyroll fold domain-containing protein [Bacillus sp. FJAT-26390]|uniref:LamG-like jellyroll fold domain-containing protein n=1 Tax=Bacillus sp. FJAT-26390 TaxID=1743142 RepID=UPI000807BDD4|nr:LamG-like jellyroll fold domain-containing protein [Bacillus sp. FJAT-26390]OBZ17621.1 hypothetical protein A7975_07130 [Bacillus sp. FJAT-26390]